LGDTEGIDLPTDLWMNVELSHKELLPNHQVINQIVMSCCGLIWSTPTATNEIKPSILDVFLDLGSSCLILLLPPKFEVLNLSESKCVVFIFFKLLHG